MIDAVLLAGGQDTGELVTHTGVAYRPLLEVGGRTILSRTLDTLSASASIGRVAVVAPEPVLATVSPGSADLHVLAAGDFVTNLLAGVDALAAPHVLIVTGDLPLLSTAALDDFVQQSLAAGAEVTYPIIPKAACEARFPHGRRTYAKLRDGTFTGGNAVVISRDFANRSRKLLAALYASRKNPLKLAALFGAGFILGLLTGRLTLLGLEARASRIIGGRVRAIVTHYAELGFDVDKLDDLRVAEAALAMPGKQ